MLTVIESEKRILLESDEVSQPLNDPPAAGGASQPKTSAPKRAKKILVSEAPLPHLPKKRTASTTKRTSTVPEVDLGPLRKRLAALESLGHAKAKVTLLHRYNDIRDVVTDVLGRMAVLRGVSVQELFKEYGLDLLE